MSHAFTGPSYITYHHNGDFSGRVVIAPADVAGFGIITEEEGVEIPFEDIRALYLESLRQRSIAELENMVPDDLEKRLLP